MNSIFSAYKQTSNFRMGLSLIGFFLLGSAQFSCSVNSEAKVVSFLPIESHTVKAEDQLINKLLPNEFKLEEGQSVNRHTYSIDEGGRFTLIRTIDTDFSTLGVGVVPITKEIAKEQGVTPFSGVLVKSVNKRSSAEKSGIELLDVISRFNNVEVSDVNKLQFLISQTKPGDEVEIEYKRKGDETPRKSKIKLGKVSRTVKSKAFTEDLKLHDDVLRAGYRLIEIPKKILPIVRHDLQLSDVKGPSAVFISAMLPGGPSFYSDLRVQDQIIEVNGKSVHSIADYNSATEASRPDERIEIKVRRGEEVVTDVIRLDDNSTSHYVFNLLGLIHVEGEARHSSFGMIFDLLFHYHNWRMITKIDDSYYPEYKTEWGSVINLLSYSNSPKRWNFTLFWILPITVNKY